MTSENTIKKKEREKHKTSPRHPLSLRANLIIFMLIFLAVVLLVTWLFQVLLLDFVYQNVKKDELEEAANTIANTLGTEEFESTVYDESMEGLMSILVYRIDGDRAVKIIAENASVGDGQQFFISPKRMAELYVLAKDAGGDYHSRVTFGGHEVKNSFLHKLFPKNPGESDAFVTPEMVNMLYVHLCNDQDNNQYMLLLNSSCLPLATTEHTLRLQFVWVFFILIAVTLLIAIPISRRISRPIVHMNEAAKQLATGNYQADFSEVRGTYRETRELADSLNYAAQELSRNDQLQKELIANISHDLRTPLTMIRGYGEAMRDIPGENTPENVQVLIDEAEHLTELVNDLLDLSKIQSGVRCPVMEFFNLTAAIREVMLRYEAFTKQQGYQIQLEADCDAMIFADRNMALQVIYNLINNAINYTGKDLKVTVRQTVSDGFVRISVIDTGEGIPKDQIPMIWDRYYKVDKVHSIAKIGTGLGLSIVKQILEIHNAKYGVESEEGKGTTFWFEIPLSVPPEEQE